MLLQVQGLRTYVSAERGVVRCVDGVELAVRKGEVLGLIGETGSGKSMTARSVLGLVHDRPGVLEGEIVFSHDGQKPVDLLPQCGVEITERDEQDYPVRWKKNQRVWRGAIKEKYKSVWGRQISMICQDPETALNPFWTVGKQLAEAIDIGEKGKVAGNRSDTPEDWLKRVYVSLEKARAYPHELSGGQRQRVMIALALASRPALVLADEPTTGLDVTTQVGIVKLFRRLRSEFGLTVLLISHDMGLISRLSDCIAVMYCGKIVEYGKQEDIIRKFVIDSEFQADLDNNVLSEELRQSLEQNGVLFSSENTFSIERTERKDIMWRITDGKKEVIVAKEGDELEILRTHPYTQTLLESLWASSVQGSSGDSEEDEDPEEDAAGSGVQEIQNAAADPGDLPDASLPEFHLRETIRNAVADPGRPPSGCRFHPRCRYSEKRCEDQEPEWMDLGGEHRAACWRL